MFSLPHFCLHLLLPYLLLFAIPCFSWISPHVACLGAAHSRAAARRWSAEVDVEDNIVNIYGSFDSGPLELTIGWDGEERTLHYNVSPPPPPAAFVAVSLPSGSLIGMNTTITVIFDNPPAGVFATAGIVTTVGRTVTISGSFTPGPLALQILWDDGSHTFNYTVLPVNTIPDVVAPTVVGGTVEDGDKDWDPEIINTDAIIVIEFSEEVIGDIALQTEAGDDVGWNGKVEGDIGALLLVKGKEIRHETTYVIVGTVSDVAGNTTDFSITFVTKGK